MTNMPKTIEVIVSRDGQIRIESKGFAGAECRHATKSLEEALGVRRGEQVTGDFYQQAAIVGQIQRQGRS